MNAITRLWYSVKAMTSMSWGRSYGWWTNLLGSTTFDYRASAGDGRSNAAVMACVRWAQRTLPEAPLIVSTRNRQGELKPQPNHALQALFETPNPFYSGLDLIGAVLADLMLTGNAYVFKIRSGNRRVVQLWWAPASLVEPKWSDTDPSVYIDHYDYWVEGDVKAVAVEDVLHFRQGFDPANVRKGMSDLAALWREIATDNEAANWEASLLRNGAVPGVIISPEVPTGASQASLDKVKDDFKDRFGGDNRGAPLVMKGPTKVQVLSFSPQDMGLRDRRIVPEERITAVLGIPAIVVGLGAGLQRSTFANFAEAREAAYESFVIPMQRILAATIQSRLVPDFGDPAILRVSFDLSKVRVLQDDQNALHERTRGDLLAGLLTLNQALEAIGEDPLTGPEGDVRYVPGTITVTPPDRLIPPEPAEVPEEPVPSSEDATGSGGEPSGPRALAAAGVRNGHAKLSDAERAGRIAEERLLIGGRSLRDILIANGMREGDVLDCIAGNGHAKAALGPALTLSETDLDRLSQIGPDDLPAAERFWRSVVDDDLDDLLEARPTEDGD